MGIYHYRGSRSRKIAVGLAFLICSYLLSMPSAAQVTLEPVVITGKRVPQPAPRGATFISKGGGTLNRITNTELKPSRYPKEFKEEPVSDNNTKLPCEGMTDKPVVLSTGEKVLPQDDFVSMSQYGMSLNRTFRSRQPRGRGFGGKWGFSLDAIDLTWSGNTCDMDRICYPTTATMTDWDGTRIAFFTTKDFGYYTARGNASAAASYERSSPLGNKLQRPQLLL